MIERKVTHHSAASASANGAVMNTTGLVGVLVQLTGTFTATVTFQGTIDQSNWVAIKAENANTGAVGTTATAAGLYYVPFAGVRLFRANMVWSAGTSITVTGIGVGSAPGSTFGNPNVTAAGLAKAEDAAHSSGDVGVMALAVRQDIPATVVSADGDYSPLSVDQTGRLRVNVAGTDWSSMIGQIELRADNSGWAVWEKVARQAKHVYGTDLNRQFRQGPWAIHMNGGAQAGGEDWASVQIPINEMHIPDLDEIQYTYYKFRAGTSHVGAAPPNIVISVHDPDDHDQRADINTTASASGTVTVGWHETIFNRATSAVFWYGNVSGSGLAEGTGTVHTWANFQDDVVFSTWTVYRIQIDYGFWGGTRSTGDAWIGSIQINNIAVKMEPTDLNDLGTRRNFTGSPFSEPTLMAAQNSDAVWSRANATETVASLQKGSTGWLANLYGGLQTNGRSFAAIYIPVNELPFSLFNTAHWTYWFSAAEEHGVNMVIWAHDPYAFEKRAEITQAPSGAGLAKASGWNVHELNPSTSQFWYYGEGVANTSITPTAGTQYTWAAFQNDECFSTWTIYRVSFEYGYYDAVTTFADAWVADIKLNNEQIPLKPDSSGTGRIGHRFFTQSGSGDLTGALAPKTMFRLLSIDALCSAVPVAGEVIKLTKDAWQGSLYDNIIFSSDMGASGVTSLYQTFEGYQMFLADDELDLFQDNGGAKNWGVTIFYQTVFGGM